MPLPPVDMDARPNVVVILTDDLDVAGFEEIPEFRPHLQDRGLRFTQSFVSLSMCCPSRATLLRGQYAHNTGIFWNTGARGGFRAFVDTGDEASTVAVWLQESGYATALFGKYLNGYPEQGDRRYIPPGWSSWWVPIGGDPYGEFGYVVNHDGRRERYGHRADDYMTDVLAREAAAWIEAQAATADPFFLLLSTYSPHAPAHSAPRYADAYADRAAPRDPAWQEADLSDKPEWLRGKALLSDAKVAADDHLYRKRLRSTRAIVDLVADTMAAIERTGQLDRTYVFFTSDNGFHFGQHRLGAGKNGPYDPDLRVPLVVVGPGVPAGQTSDALVVNVDFAPTIAELAGVQPPAWVDGRSLVPLLHGRRVAWREAFLLEHRGPLPPRTPQPWAPVRAVLEPADADADAGPDGRRSPAHRGVPVYAGLRTHRWKYLEYISGERELYDLDADPGELDNIAATADPGLLRSLHRWLGRMRVCAGEECRQLDGAAPAGVE